MANADYLIIGGGTAGCVLATRLKEKLPHASVTVLEAGTDEHENPLISEMMNAFRLHDSNYEYKYSTVPQKSYDGRQVFNAGSKVLSGSSAVNFGNWQRGSKVDYDLWAQAVGDERWSYEGLLPYFKRSEKHYKAEEIDMAVHGHSGPIHTIISTDREYPLKDAVIDSYSKATGLPYVADANAGDPVGIAPYTETWRGGKRQPVGLAYWLGDVTVSTNAVVKRVIIDDTGLVTGVELADGRIVGANREVIVSCGVFRSPQVLALSGIGPKDQLLRYGIKPAAYGKDFLEAAEKVGENLSDHIAVPMPYKVKNPEKGLAAGSPAWTHPDYLLGMPVDILIIGNASNEATKEAMIRDGTAGVTDDHPYLKPRRGHWEVTAEEPLTNLNLPLDGSIITCGILNLLPTSRGSVKLASADTAADPLIDPNYLATEVDKTVTRAAMRASMRALETGLLADHIEGHFPPPGYEELSSQSTDADLDAYVRRVAATWFHSSGSCAMGSVVDSECKVFGLQNLRVGDASVFPAPMSCHYQAPVCAVAEQMADIIAKAAS